MENKVEKILQIDNFIYDLEYLWRLDNVMCKLQAETNGRELAMQRKALLGDLTADERERYYLRSHGQILPR